jgi:DNA-directed RNA polymerase specialized sigma24 family protein
VRGNFTYTDNATANDVVNQAARRIHKRYAQYSELEDLVQEAHIMVATRGDHQRAIEDENYGYLQHQLELDLTDMLDTTVRRAQKNVSYDALREAQGADEEGGYITPYVVIETLADDYTRESVESLLPAVWDESYSYGMPARDDAPDPDMPKGSTNKARGNNLAAYIADIKTGWEKTPLTQKERIAVLLAYGMGWTQKQIAFNQNVTQQTIQKRIENAVGKITARLNGGYWYELNGVEA